MKRILAAVILAACAVSVGAAQLYRSVDADGRVEWRDTPPVGTERKVEARNVQGNVMSSSMPYAVQRAAKDFPVTLWTTACGDPCDAARRHLARRGIPHAVKDAKADADALRQATGGLDVPVLLIGRTQIRGYSASEWDNALDAVGYPRLDASASASAR